jgi:hypothetical protein
MVIAFHALVDQLPAAFVRLAQLTIEAFKQFDKKGAQYCGILSAPCRMHHFVSKTGFRSFEVVKRVELTHIRVVSVVAPLVDVAAQR